MRQVALSRKDSLVVGNDEGSENRSGLSSVIETYNFIGVSRWSKRRIDELMPWPWAPQQ
jgi:hypothetical protein